MRHALVRETGVGLEAGADALASQPVGCKAATDTSNWMFSVTNREASENEFLNDSGVPASV